VLLTVRQVLGVQSHIRSLPYQEVAEALAIVGGSGASQAAKLYLRFVVLTAARSGEARSAVWDEIDFDACEWRIPATRMKAANEHRVPLSDAALEVLKGDKSLHDGSGLVVVPIEVDGQPANRGEGRPKSMEIAHCSPLPPPVPSEWISYAHLGQDSNSRPRFCKTNTT